MPYLLYTIMLKSLCMLLEYERNYGNLLRIKIARGVKSINHSHFVDDTLLFGRGLHFHSAKIQ
jgi:hypothetical protein